VKLTIFDNKGRFLFSPKDINLANLINQKI
jgi:hypothetical protein